MIVPVYLERYLEPLAAMLARPDVTDIFINRPGELWVERLAGGTERHAAPGITEAGLNRLARQVAAVTHQGVSREHPILSATLPGGARVQIVAPPATRGPMAVAIRKHGIGDLSLDDVIAPGAGALSGKDGAADEAAAELGRLLNQGDAHALLRAAVRQRRNIVIAGGTSTGKTTVVNALLKEIPAEERLILIEDAPELRIAHPNAVGLVAVTGALGEADVRAEDLLRAALRMRPDRIILGELRGSEAFSFLRAINSGHPGSITTLHANSPEGAMEQLALLIAQQGLALGRADILAYVERMVDLFVQLERRDGMRRISDIRLGPALRPRPPRPDRARPAAA
jgi:type IV secretion system protein VirB11